MNPVSFVCPKTLQEIDSGIDVDCASLRHVQPVTVRLVCPHRRQPHVWKIADGLLKSSRVGGAA